ncbi:MAG: phosphoribosylglycinamide formyltransferase [Gammaproteobacteria bacterium]|nr:phosphoribosylglycinamide formyltransferase [Gammaproteobacteria bacterium]
MVLLKIGFLASHGGSAMRYLFGAIQSGELDACVSAVISNNRDSVAYSWALEAGLNPVHISAKTHPGAEHEDLAICEALGESDTVVLSGYMKRLGPQTLARFPNRILNIHPALLPKFGGQGMYGDRVHAAVLDAGAAHSGATVHVVNEHYDEGPILGQSTIAVEATDTVESLRTRVQALEGPLFLKVLKTLSAQDPVTCR